MQLELQQPIAQASFILSHLSSLQSEMFLLKWLNGSASPVPDLFSKWLSNHTLCVVSRAGPQPQRDRTPPVCLGLIMPHSHPGGPSLPAPSLSLSMMCSSCLANPLTSPPASPHPLQPPRPLCPSVGLRLLAANGRNPGQLV